MSKRQKIIITVINSLYLMYTLFIMLVLYEYTSDIFSDFSRFKIMHPMSEIVIFLMTFVLWNIFLLLLFKYHKKIINQDKSVIIYGLMPYITLLIIFLVNYLAIQ